MVDASTWKLHGAVCVGARVTQARLTTETTQEDGKQFSEYEYSCVPTQSDLPLLALRARVDDSSYFQ